MTSAQPRHLLVFPNNCNSNRLKSELTDFNWQAHIADDVVHALDLAKKHRILVGLVVFDSVCDEATIKLLQACLKAFEQTNSPIHWVMILPEGFKHNRDDFPKECDLIAQFCHDFLTYPADIERLLFCIGHAYGMSELISSAYRAPANFSGQFGIIGKSPPMLTLFSRIDKVAKEDYPVLIQGETGTGKEMIANAIHNNSQRKFEKIVVLNCGAFPKDLIQAELFGHEKGAFTGAHQRRIGRIESAQRGTLFLDEIGDLPLDQQVNLLRFLEEKTIERVGSTEKITIDARVIAATHINLKDAVASGRFREDLYYRLCVLQIKAPPLRERDGDAEELATYFLKKYTSTNSYKAKGFNIDALELINLYDWPGNIRELMNCIRHAVVMADNCLLTPADLNLERRCKDRYLKTLELARADADKETILACLRHTHSNMAQVAKILGISRASLYRLIEKYQLNV